MLAHLRALQYAIENPESPIMLRKKEARTDSFERKDKLYPELFPDVLEFKDGKFVLPLDKPNVDLSGFKFVMRWRHFGGDFPILTMEQTLGTKKRTSQFVPVISRKPIPMIHNPMMIAKADDGKAIVDTIRSGIKAFEPQVVKAARLKLLPLAGSYTVYDTIAPFYVSKGDNDIFLTLQPVSWIVVGDEMEATVKNASANLDFSLLSQRIGTTDHSLGFRSDMASVSFVASTEKSPQWPFHMNIDLVEDLSLSRTGSDSKSSVTFWAAVCYLLIHMGTNAGPLIQLLRDVYPTVKDDQMRIFWCLDLMKLYGQVKAKGKDTSVLDSLIKRLEDLAADRRKVDDMKGPFVELIRSVDNIAKSWSQPVLSDVAFMKLSLSDLTNQPVVNRLVLFKTLMACTHVGVDKDKKYQPSEELKKAETTEGVLSIGYGYAKEASLELNAELEKKEWKYSFDYENNPFAKRAYVRTVNAIFTVQESLRTALNTDSVDENLCFPFFLPLNFNNPKLPTGKTSFFIVDYESQSFTYYDLLHRIWSVALTSNFVLIYYGKLKAPFIQQTLAFLATLAKENLVFKNTLFVRTCRKDKRNTLRPLQTFIGTDNTTKPSMNFGVKDLVCTHNYDKNAEKDKINTDIGLFIRGRLSKK